MAKKELSLDEILKKLEAAEKEFDEKMKNSGLDKIIAEDTTKKAELKWKVKFHFYQSKIKVEISATDSVKIA